MKKRIALQQTTDIDTPWDAAPYDVYELDSDLPFGTDLDYDFDDLTFVGTITSHDELPTGARQINEDEPTNSDYSATYELPTEAPQVGPVSEVDTEVAAQLRRELEAAVSPLAALAGPDAWVDWPRTIAARAPMVAARLVQDDDDRLAAQTVIDVMVALWPHGDPEDHDPDWWRTPLGRVVARSLGREDSEAVTHSVAAAMLGVTRGTVAQLVTRGTLDRHPDGGVDRASVLRRIARQGTTG